MRYLKIFGVLNLLLLLLSCGLVKEGFQNPKKKSSDEFLVEKKSPLVMPPNFNELPIPKRSQNDENSDDNKIKELLEDKETKLKNNSETTEMNNSLEENLIEKIKKN
ncbi:DUF3035 domain-containing protein [Candidatus Pelagibacter sp.]|nr:DUF3035 domain-containing protein [Candidatus Pelagibacter sp.]